MTGGASGTQPVIDAAAQSSARSSLVSALSSALAASLKKQVPSGYVLLPGAATTTYDTLPLKAASSTGKASVRVQGTIRAVVFPNSALAGAIASSTLSMNYQGAPLTLATSSGLTLSPLSTLPATSSQSFTFALSGTAQRLYTVQKQQIAAAVAGKSRSAAKVALTNFPEVKAAVLVLHPFWRSSFPQDPTAISVQVAQ